jgi:esterase/lipase superfamily enzyme
VWLLPLLFAQAVLSGCARNMMATPLIYRDADVRMFEELAPELQGNRIPVLYVTDRKPETDDTDGGRFYGSERSASTAFGIAHVKVGRGAGSWEAMATQRGKTGELAQATSRSPIELVSAKELVRFPATPYSFQIGERGAIRPDDEVLAELERATATARREIRRRLALTPKKEVIVLVHGVANRFDDAIISAAEFWNVLGREGVPIAYTWPAGAKGLVFYNVDRESGEFTVLHLKQFLRALAAIPEIEKIHIAAHSRGTDVAASALRELIIESRAAGEDPRDRYKIENLVMIAADLDVEVAMQRLVGEAIGPAVGRITLYTNAKDSALAAAKRLFSSYLRVGAIEPTTLTARKRTILERVANLDVIVYEGPGGGIFRHGYFRDPVASSDIVLLLRYGFGPGEGGRRGLEQLSPNIWRIADPAPAPR